VVGIIPLSGAGVYWWDASRGSDLDISELIAFAFLLTPIGEQVFVQMGILIIKPRKSRMT